MKANLLRTTIGALLGLALAGTADASPLLKRDVTVTNAVVTVGDMFDDAGIYAEQPLFRAPAPGTSGLVGISAIREATAKVGLVDFGAEGVIQVRVSRAATAVDESLLTGLIATDLKNRGILTEGMSADALFDTPLSNINADAVTDPAKLVNLRYLPGNGAFSARFMIAGVDKPLDVSGRIELMVSVPHLARTLPAGTIIEPADITMKMVPLRFAESSGAAQYEQLVGNQLQRQSREGMMLRAVDVAQPQLVSRNEFVTIVFRKGNLTLTVKGQALNSAVEGGPVAVLNQMSKRIVNGVAKARGTVEVPSGPVDLAGL